MELTTLEPENFSLPTLQSFDWEEEENTTSISVFAVTSYSLTSIVILSIVIGVMATVTIAGNTLVIVSFATDRKLRSFGNYFILNLAISDLIVGLLIVVYAPYILRGECWHLSRAGCLAFLLLDYVVPLASAWNMALISLDRYWSVTRPIAYRTDLNTTKAVVFMCIPWLAGTLWYGPTVLFWPHLSGNETSPTPDRENVTESCQPCQVDFVGHAIYLLFSSFIEFLLPFLTVTTINVLIYANIRRRSLGLLASKDAQRTAKAKNLLSRDKKSARSLAILVIVFLLTWGPFEICSFVNPLCGFSIPQAPLDIVFWLLWLNSTINPVLYPFLQQRFRVAFMRILCSFERFRSSHNPAVRIYSAAARNDTEPTGARQLGLSNISPTFDQRGATTTTVRI